MRFLAFGLALLLGACTGQHRSLNFFGPRPATLPITDDLTNDAWVHLSLKAKEFMRGYLNETFPADGWSAENDCFILESEGFGNDLMTKDRFENFELEFRWLLSKGGNSGILFAVQEGAPYSYTTGPEIQLIDELNHPDAKRTLSSFGALYDIWEPLIEAKKGIHFDRFNYGRILFNKTKLSFYVNQILVNEVDFADPRVARRIAESKFKKYSGFYKEKLGHVLFQDHGGRSEFCNVRIRKI